VYEFHSSRAEITLHLGDNYKVRNDVLALLQRNSRSWLELALGRAPVELQASLQKYLALGQPTSLTDVADLGASVAEEFGKAIGPSERQLSESLSQLVTGELISCQRHWPL
jgi:phosphatidylinositol 4-kinase A